MTKVAFAHYSSPTDISGVTTWLEKLVIRLRNDQVPVDMHLHHFGQYPEHASILPSLRDAGVNVISVRRGKNLREDVLSTLNFLDKSKPTVFLPQCLNAHYLAASICGKQGLPWALTMHSDDPDYWAIADFRPPARWGGEVVCVSEYLSTEIKRQHLEQSSTVIPCGVSIPSSVTSFASESFHVVYSGRLVETQKRLSLVVEALVRACLKNSAIHASIIGDGSSRRDCQAAVDRAGLSNRIIFKGRLSTAEVEDELLHAQAILLMSDFEGLPVALIEAMAAGVVPVVRQIPSGIPELVKHEHTGLMVDETPENAARAICRLAQDHDLWKRCSSSARRLVAEQYNEDISYNRWLELIEKLDQKCTIQYPIRNSDHFELPPRGSRLNGGYENSRPLWMRLASRVKRAFK